MQPADPWILGLEGLEYLVRVVGLNPRTEEARGDAQMRLVVDDLLELETSEPGVEHILANLSPETGTYPLKQL